MGINMGLKLLLGAGLTFIGLNTSNASPVSVNYTLNGQPGNWTYDFTVRNYIGNTNEVYYFGVKTPQGANGVDIVSSPPSWQNAAQDYPENHNPSGIDYNNLWLTNTGSGAPIQDGDSLTGFEVVDNSTVFDVSIPWFAFAIDGTDRQNDGHFGYFGNPGFEGISTVNPVPEPATWPLMILGIGAMGAVLRRRCEGALVAALSSTKNATAEGRSS